MSRFASTIGTLATAAHSAVAAISDIAQVSGGNLPQALTLSGLAALGLTYTAIASRRSEKEQQDLREKVDSLVRSDTSDRNKAQQLIDLFDLPTDGNASNESALVLLAHGLKRQADQQGITLDQVNAAIPKIVESLDRIEGKLDEVLQRSQQTDELVAKVEARYCDELAELRRQNTELRSDKSTLRSALEFAQEQARRGDKLSEEAIAQLQRDGETEKLLEALIIDRDRNQQATMERNRQVAEIAYLRGDIKTAESAIEAVLAIDGNDLAALNTHCTIRWMKGDLHAAKLGYEQILALSSNNLNYQAIAHGNLGVVLRSIGDLDGAERMLLKALEIDAELGWKEGISNAYGNLGLLYRTRGDLTNAAKMHFKALEIDIEIGRTTGVASEYGNLGILFESIGELDVAEDLLRRALAIDERLGRKEGMATAHSHLGIIFHKRGDIDSAKESYLRAIAIEESIGRKEGMANSYGNLGILYRDSGDLDGAEAMIDRALAIDIEIQRKEGEAQSYANLGGIAVRRGQHLVARRHWIRCLELYRAVGISHMVEKVQSWLDELDADSPPAAE